MLVCVTGVSGSGKSTGPRHTVRGLKEKRGEWNRHVGFCKEIKGADLVDDVILVDQSPIGRTPRSNPVTYIKAYDAIREVFAATNGAKTKGFNASHFSFNVPGGRCEICQGSGTVTIEMQFLADVELTCEDCRGMVLSRTSWTSNTGQKYSRNAADDDSRGDTFFKDVAKLSRG